MRVTAAIVMLSLGGVAAGGAPQDTAPPPTFEVASIRINESDFSGWSADIAASPLVRVTNIPLRQLIARSYGIQPSVERFKLAGGPEHVLSARFDITAKRPEGVPADQNLAMLRTLLAQRFGLRIRTENRTRPVYALTQVRAGRFGPQLAASTYTCEEARRMRKAPGDPIPAGEVGKVCFSHSFAQPGVFTERHAGSLADLIVRIQAFVDRPVVDATGLSGLFRWDLSFAIRHSADAPQIFTALDEQLGLKLRPTEGEVETLVIESVSMPTPN